MKHDEVPQDELPYYGEQRKAVYALDGTGQYSAVPSSGWTVEATVTGEAIHEFERLAAAARQRAAPGLCPPLEYHMYADRKTLVKGKSVSVRLYFESCRSIKKQKA